MNNDTQTLASKFVTRVRNDTLADVFHHLRDKVSAQELADIYGMHMEQIYNLERRKYRRG